MTDSQPEAPEEYQATLYHVGGEIVAIWQDQLYRVGSEVSSLSSGKIVAEHDSVFLKDGVVYSAIRDHDGLEDNEAVFYYGDVSIDDTSTFYPTKLVGVRSARGVRLLEPLDEIDPDREARCAICGFQTDTNTSTKTCAEAIREHIDRMHVNNGEFTADVIEQLYEVVE